MNESVRSVLLGLVGKALFGAPFDMSKVSGWEQTEWESLYAMAARQGVLAVVYDVVSADPEIHLQRKLNLQWGLGVANIENRYDMQLRNAAELAKIWADAGLRTVVLKGFAISRYYPVPNHRECGDFDCFMGADTEKANLLAVNAGALLEDDGYKHSHIIYKNLMVENHRFCIAIRGSRELKEVERYLEHILEVSPMINLPGTDILVPPVAFTALFMTAHGLLHFVHEGIKLRHVCDWACLIAHEEMNIDWTEFYSMCDRYKMRRYVDALTSIAVHDLGLRLKNPAITVESIYADRVLRSVLDDDRFIYNHKIGRWKGRAKLISNVYHSRWKSREIYQKSYMSQIARLVTGFLIDRHPKL